MIIVVLFMENYSLKLKPYNLDSINVKLYDDQKKFDFEKIDNALLNKVYADKTYDIQLVGKLDDVKSVSLYINGFEKESNYYNGQFDFYDNNKRIFIDNFGFVQISAVISYFNNDEITLYSDYFSVMIKENETSNSIRKIADYVYKNQEKLLFDGTMNSLDMSSVKKSEKNTIESQLKIIQDIVKEYSQSYRYFKTNSKFTLINNSVVDKYEKLNYVSPDTISYITQHPEELTEVQGNFGIYYNKKRYIPKNTLILNNKVSFDIYENQVVVGFLNTLINSIANLKSSIKKRILRFNETDVSRDGYKASAYIIYGETKKKLEHFSEQLTAYIEELNALLKRYKIILPVSNVSVINVPKPSHIFMSIKHYNRIYKCITKWYEFGIYDLKQDEFLLPFLANSQLYEYYVLLKLYNFFIRDFEFQKKDKFVYKVLNSKFFRNTMYANTYYFKKNDISLILYYQPVIYLKKNKVLNDVDLIRNTKLSRANHINQKEREGRVYLPDYILKISNNTKTNYIILDSKFSNVDTVKSWYFPELVFKYLFSLSPINKGDEIIGLCAINGKTNDDEKFTSVYTDEISEEYTPFANIITLTETNEELLEKKQFDILSKCFDKYIKTFE